MAQSVGKCDVLIAGFGPVGAALAVYLGRLGISVIAVDRDTEVYPMPRAAHLDHETMRLLHLAGGAEAGMQINELELAREIGEAEERWLELEMLREEIGA